MMGAYFFLLWALPFLRFAWLQGLRTLRKGPGYTSLHSVSVLRTAPIVA